MSLPRIAYRNLWREGTIIAVSTENAQYPAEETQEDSPQSKWRTTSAPTGGDTIDCDFGAAYEYDLIGILGHNIQAGATIQVIGADDDAFTSNVVTDTLTYVGNNLWQILGTARTKRYCRVSVIDVGNPSGYVAIGTIIVAKGNALDRKYQPGIEKGYQNETAIEEVPSGVDYVTQERESRANYVYTFPMLSAASAAIIHSAIGDCGSHKAVAVCLDPTTPNGNTPWVKIVDQSLLRSEVYALWTWSAVLREVL
jgi:hypothetical protein